MLLRSSLALACVALLILLAGCSSPVYTPAGAPVEPRSCSAGPAVTQSVFLIGDAGAPVLAPEGSPRGIADPLLHALHENVQTGVAALGADAVTVVFLGDNVYPLGLPREDHPDRREGERILEAQMAASEPGQAIFTLGNHDWHREGSEGWERALEQRDFLERFEPRVRMQPPGGCAGPDRVDIGRHLRMVFIDPIGFSHLFEHPEQHKQACSPRSVVEATLDLAAQFDHADGRHMLLALHHPLITAGPHGGHYTWKQHIFPLTDFWSWAWLPLPIIGSVYPLSRQLGVTGTDASSKPYQRWVNGIYRATRPRVPFAFVGGHEHSLQVHRDALGSYYLVSGAGTSSKVNRVVDVPTSMLAAPRPGYMRLDVLADASIELRVTAIDAPGQREGLLRHCLVEGPPRKSRRPPERQRPGQ